MWVSFGGRVGCVPLQLRPPPPPSFSLPPSFPTRPLGLQLTHPIRFHPIPTYLITIISHLLWQKGEENIYFMAIQSYVDVLGSNGKAKPPALGGGGDDTAADLLPQCSHGGQVLLQSPPYH